MPVNQSSNGTSSSHNNGMKAKIMGLRPTGYECNLPIKKSPFLYLSQFFCMVTVNWKSLSFVFVFIIQQLRVEGFEPQMSLLETLGGAYQLSYKTLGRKAFLLFQETFLIALLSFSFSLSGVSSIVLFVFYIHFHVFAAHQPSILN